MLIDPFIAGRGDGFGGRRRGADSPTRRDAAPMPQAKGSAARANRRLWRDLHQGAATRAFRTALERLGGGLTAVRRPPRATPSSDRTERPARIYGIAVGADYGFSPNTMAGFALAAAAPISAWPMGWQWPSDLFQAGAFMRHNIGPAYMSGALAYGWQDVTTDRTVTIAGIDQLRAKFNANAFSGRVEGGYRFVDTGGSASRPMPPASSPPSICRPMPSRSSSGANTFALGYGAKSVTDTRSELGLRTDRSFAMQNAMLTLRGRAAWAHDFNPDRAVAATFQTLPGARFIVNGARAGARFRADHRLGRNEVAERLVDGRHVRRRVLQRHALAMPARASCDTRGRMQSP